MSATLVFITAWNFAPNLPAPFITVYLLRQLGLGLGAVTALWATSQVASIGFAVGLM